MILRLSSSQRRSRIASHRLATFVTVAVLAAFPARAQETIYVLQETPSEIWGFTFDGSSITPYDIAPDPSEERLSYSPASRRFAATDHWFLLGNGSSSSSTNITDPNGVSLPPSATTVAGNGSLVASFDGRHAFAIEENGFVPAQLAVVDIDPASATFLAELTTLDLQVGGVGVARRGVLSADGLTLYVVVDGFGSEQPCYIHAIDVSDPASLDASDILSTTAVSHPAAFGITWDPATRSLRRYTLGGTEYLFLLRQSLQVIEVGGPGTLSLVMSQASPHPTFGTMRDVRDVAVFDDGASPAAVAIASSCEWNGVDACLATGEEEILAIDLTLPLPLEDDGTAPTRIVASHRILSPDGEAGTAPPGDEYVILHGNRAQVLPSFDGQNAYVLSNNPSPGAPVRGRVMAFDVDEVTSLPADTATFVGPTQFTEVWGADMLVRNEVTPAPGAPGITDAALDAAEGGGVAIINDAPRALDVTGSGLSSVAKAFLGTSFLTVDAVASTALDATVPAFVPTGNPQLGVITDTGAIGTYEGLAVVPPPDFLPSGIAYVGNEGSISTVSASTSTQVSTSFDSILGLNGLAVSSDGRYLVANGFPTGEFGVHCIVHDDETASAGDPGNPLGLPSYQWSGCADWNDLMYSHQLSGGFSVSALAATKPDGSRAYVNTIWPTIDIVDLTASPPLVVGSIEASNTAFFGADPTYLVRGVAASGTHLYLGNDGLNRQCGGTCGPGASGGVYVIAVDIADDVVDPLTEIHPIDIPALSAASAFGRGDGLAVHPDESRLYYAMAASPNIWILDIGASPTAPTAIAGPAVPDFDVGDVFNLAIAPDGSFLYVGRRSGSTHVYDLTDKDDPVLVTTLATGPFTNVLRVSPDGKYVYVPVATREAVVVIDARPGSPTQHEVLTVVGAGQGASVVAITPGLELEESPVPVTVEPVEGAEITLPNVGAGGGEISVTAANVAETPPPADFEIAGLGVFYNVETTATIVATPEDPIVLCFDYDDSLLTPDQELSLKLLHEEELDGSKCEPPGAVPCWDDVTQLGSPDIVANEICGEVTSFSLFVAAIQATVRPRIDIKPDDPDNEINLSSNATINVGIYGSEAFDVDTVVASSLALAGGPVKQKKKGAAVVYTDLDGDGYLDVKAQFLVSAMEVTESDTEAEVSGELTNGQQMVGTDEITVIE